MNEEKNELNELINSKVDHSKLKSFADELGDDIKLLQNELKGRLTKVEVTDLISKGGSSEEISADMQNIT
eukprot:CAMPEP_0185589804 /NCGR_PEP_ID=MMETSP0434-20130131/58387_1 /TAXON_ID=626734 ORGANISM="Favella taraikaensis, Strain Fe Narragansett Bay" /NCGR_SAMPLE_ID=MMETSP0434 /ASSEMBLY_ACC=CAM_ASM_000379 /LENGTH=69 /DNA_ID=CAMNT_0028213499 /DNA_START=716 /DNA_END=925 /DNA_ORIENTATION=+